MDMKKIFFSLLMLMFLQVISGQDKIITIQHDTIFCRIISISPAHIHYEQISENGYTIGKFIPTEHILEYFRSSQLSKINHTGNPNPLSKHYLGLSIAHGVGKYKDYETWNIDYIGMGFDYAYCVDDTDLGIGIT